MQQLESSDSHAVGFSYNWVLLKEKSTKSFIQYPTFVTDIISECNFHGGGGAQGVSLIKKITLLVKLLSNGHFWWIAKPVAECKIVHF